MLEKNSKNYKRFCNEYSATNFISRLYLPVAKYIIAKYDQRRWTKFGTRLNIMRRLTFWTPQISPGDTLERSLLRHYATSRRVAGSIPDEVIAFFN
jgi:hypothetical protein